MLYKGFGLRLYSRFSILWRSALPQHSDDITIYLAMSQKTRKAFAKRFKVTGSGRVMRRSPNSRHLLRNKSVKQKRRYGQDQEASAGVTRAVRKAMPHAF